MNFKLQSEYFMISDPPLIADIGQFYIDLSNLTLAVKLRTSFENGILSLDLDYLDIDLDPIGISFDGISDASDVLTRSLTFALNVIRDRVISISRYTGYRNKFTKTIQMINAILSMVPDEYSIAGF